MTQLVSLAQTRHAVNRDSRQRIGRDRIDQDVDRDS